MHLPHIITPPPGNPEPANSYSPAHALPPVASGDASSPSLVVTDSKRTLPRHRCHFHPQLMALRRDFLRC